MRLRFYIDPETGEPHVYGHQVTEAEVEQGLAALVKTGQAATSTGGARAVLYLVDS